MFVQLFNKNTYKIPENYTHSDKNEFNIVSQNALSKDINYDLIKLN